MVLTLRNYPDDDALHHPEKYSKALSFSPDILPLYGTEAKKDVLTDPSSWRGFTGMPIVGGDVNNVYIRGHGSDGPHVASMRAFPSELILWPHVWHNVDSVASGPTVIHTGDSEGRCASDGPLHFRPPHCTGNTYSLVAHVTKHVPGEDVKPPPFDLERFGVDDFVKFLQSDKEHTFYNVVVADPTLKHVTATTRLRMIGKSPVWINFRISPHEGARVPDGVEVSLTDDHGKVSVPRIRLSSFKDQNVLLDPSYDGVLMFNIFSADNILFEPYSGFSLRAYKSELLPIGSRPLLGALNIIFEPHSTRNLRFASPAAVQLRDLKDGPKVESMDEPKGDCGPIPVTTPATTGWWGRCALPDKNNYPQKGPVGCSPDIQPIGTDPNIKDILTTLRNLNQDYATAHPVNLVGDQDNYIYVRGHSTIADIDVQSRLFAAGSNPVNHPAQYTSQSVVGHVFGGEGTVNEQSISIADPNQSYVFDKPFVIRNPPADSTNHYCLITEFRQKRKCSPVWPGWPSDEWANYATLADFWGYITHCPRVYWRNINWQPCQPGGKKCWSWPCAINLVIPDCAHYSSFFTIVVECVNQSIPPGCTWSMVCDDNKLFPNGICFENQAINTRAPSTAGCHFTGARPGYRAKLTLTLTWCDGGDPKTYPPPSINWKFAMTDSLTNPLGHLTYGTPDGSDQWPCIVTEDYPYIGDRPNPSPLPTFEGAGINTWPFVGSPHAVLGQVTYNAMPQ